MSNKSTPNCDAIAKKLLELYEPPEAQVTADPNQDNVIGESRLILTLPKLKSVQKIRLVNGLPSGMCRSLELKNVAVEDITAIWFLREDPNKRLTTQICQAINNHLQQFSVSVTLHEIALLRLLKADVDSLSKQSLGETPLPLQVAIPGIRYISLEGLDPAGTSVHIQDIFSSDQIDQIWAAGQTS